MTTLNPNILNKILLSRSLYRLAEENIVAPSGIRLLICCNLLQDAIESYLLGISDFLNAGIGQRTDFDKYFDAINSKIAPKELPFRSRLISLNKLRVNSKHYGLEPAKSELEPLLTIAREFFSETSTSILGISFSSISLSDIFDDGEAKAFLKEAEEYFRAKNYAETLISCRKALFVEWERDFDAKHFENTERRGLLSLLGYRVPYFARSKEYLEKNISEPTDYIIYDRSALEIDLIKMGIDNLSYWNVWRLTPEVYRHNPIDEWIIKRDFRKLEEDGIEGRAEYVLNTTADMLWAKSQHYSRTKTPDSRRYYVELKRKGAKLFKKSSRGSEIAHIVPDELTRLLCDFSITGLDGEKYWHISHYDEFKMLSGYLHNDEIE